MSLVVFSSQRWCGGGGQGDKRYPLLVFLPSWWFVRGWFVIRSNGSKIVSDASDQDRRSTSPTLFATCSRFVFRTVFGFNAIHTGQQTRKVRSNGDLKRWPLTPRRCYTSSLDTPIVPFTQKSGFNIGKPETTTPRHQAAINPNSNLKKAHHQSGCPVGLLLLLAVWRKSARIALNGRDRCRHCPSNAARGRQDGQ